MNKINKVMNNNDLRKIIFSFLRKNPKKRCNICECICIWDKDVKKYLKVNLLEASTNINSQCEVFCLDCIDKMI